MEDEYQVIGNKEIKEIINKLIEDYSMSTECLSYLLKVKVDENSIEIPTELEKYNSFTNLILMLYTISEHEPDLRVRAFLKVLIDVHKISIDTIAKFAKIPKQYVLDFINDSEEVPTEIKYKISSVVMVLRLIFKNVEPKI